MKGNSLCVALCVVLIGFCPNIFAAEEPEDIVQSKFGGIGAAISLVPTGVMIRNVQASGPAAEAGLKQGDIIVAIDSKSTEKMSLKEVVKRLRGKPATVVTLTISRGDMEPFEVEVKRKIIPIPVPGRKWELMPYLFEWATLLLWPICYIAVIWISLIGKKENPNRGWNLIIIAEIIFLLMYIPAIYFKWYASKISYSSQLNFLAYYRYIGQGLILSLAMIIFVIGLHRIARNKK